MHDRIAVTTEMVIQIIDRDEKDVALFRGAKGGAREHEGAKYVSNQVHGTNVGWYIRRTQAWRVPEAAPPIAFAANAKGRRFTILSGFYNYLLAAIRAREDLRLIFT
jgi:hypothetical protein